MQRFFRKESTDSMAEEKSSLYGRSVSNQLIEAWLSLLRKNDTDWWINFFKKLREVGLYCDDDSLLIEYLQFYFLPLIKEVLNHIARHWNLHRFRPSLNQESSPERPTVWYFLPELKGTISSLHAFDEAVKAVAEEMCCDNSALPSDGTFAELA